MFANFSGSLILKRITGIEVGSNNFFHAESVNNLHSAHSAGEQLVHLVDVLPLSALLKSDSHAPMKLCEKTKTNSGACG